jgi:hypothetical protein
MSGRRSLDNARTYGRSLQPIHDLQLADGGVSGDDILAILDVNAIDADAQPKKVTVSGMAAAVSPYVTVTPTAPAAVGPAGAIQFSSNNLISGSSNAIFTGSGIYASGVASPSYTTDLSTYNTVSTTGYVLANTDNGRTVLFTNLSGAVLQVPAGLTPGFNCTLIQLASGQVTLTSGTSVILNSAGSTFKTARQYAVAGLIGVSSDTYVLTGETSA